MLIVYLIFNYIDSVGLTRLQVVWPHQPAAFTLRVVDLFSLGAINDKLINFCPSHNMTEPLYNIRRRVLRAELHEIVSVFTYNFDLNDRL